MTITVQYEGDQAREVEVIALRFGAEVERKRVDNNKHAILDGDGSDSWVLRIVPADTELQQLPGAVGHGDLGAPGAVSQSALEPGDLDPIGAELEQTAFDAQQRVLTVLHQFLETEGQTVQADLYHELSQAHRAYADAVAAFQAHRIEVAA